MRNVLNEKKSVKLDIMSDQKVAGFSFKSSKKKKIKSN